MKVATVTVHSAISYGAMLQAYALQRALEDLGVEAEILDYRNEMIEQKNRTIPVRAKANFQRRFKDLISAPLRYDRNKRFHQFMNRHMKLSDVTYRSIDEMKDLDKKYDAFFTGSDQVWNPKHADFDPVYFLQFVNDATKRHSYAASFGFSKIPLDLSGEYKRRLKDFHGLSVRESSGVAIIKDLLGRRAAQSLDPTLLLTKDSWQALAVAPKCQNYVLLYEVNQASSDNYRRAKQIADRKGLKVIAITQKVRSFDDVIAHQTGPEGLLGYIANAEYVLTDSFHGTVFSILFERPFTFCSNKKADVNIRMEELLNLTGLFDRKDIVDHDEPIDWRRVDRRLSKARRASLQYIKTILGRKNA